MTTVIRVDKLTKEYRLGTISHGTLKEDLESWWARLRGKEDPNSLITLNHSTLNPQPSTGSSHPSTLNSQQALNPHFLALNNVSFDVQKGEAVGIIGRNGAGKSTLLKILSRVTAPTSGVVKIKGRVASLLEVGTGFHPELTGRENIFLNGTILGMKRAEILRKFAEIVAFAEIDQFIDTPVKRYSSGMYVRLAFAVAAHLDPEILIVDEVLSVGDASFQKKCLGKMEDVSRSEGRTILFVSHNLTAIQNFCGKAVYLHKGTIADIGPTRHVVEHYLNDCMSVANLIWQGVHPENEYLKIESVSIAQQSPDSNDLFINRDIQVLFSVEVFKEVTGIAFEIVVNNLEGTVIFSSFTETMPLQRGRVKATCIIPGDTLNNMHYTITPFISRDYSYWLVRIDDALTLDIQSTPEGLGWQGEWPGVVRPRLRWQVDVAQ